MRACVRVCECVCACVRIFESHNYIVLVGGWDGICLLGNCHSFSPVDVGSLWQYKEVGSKNGEMSVPTWQSIVLSCCVL